MSQIRAFTFNAFQENTYLIYDDTKECIIVDPGCSNEQEQNTLIQFIKAQNLNPVSITNTHAHLDHILGVQFLKDHFKIPFELHPDDKFLIDDAVNQAAMFGMNFGEIPIVDNYLNIESPIKFGNTELKALFVPGHSPGSLAFYSEDDNFVVAGDALFNGSIGRTDLPKGDYNTLIQSIRTELLTLPGQTVVLSGHGKQTTIDKERTSNPFLV